MIDSKFARVAVLAIPLFKTYFESGLVSRMPTALRCMALMLVGALLLVCGTVLHAATHGRVEMTRLAYLLIPSPAPITSLAE